jgi:hypothetical protein
LPLAVTNSYNERLKYDKNGNIKDLFRNGDLDAENGITIEMDNLSYNYHPTIANQLIKVVDNSTHPEGFKDSVTNTTDDYGYDANGNMTSDLNKGITTIKYNHLNLPVQINFGTINKIEYIYNAIGIKVKKPEGFRDSATNTVDDYGYDANGNMTSDLNKGITTIKYNPIARICQRNDSGIAFRAYKEIR